MPFLGSKPREVRALKQAYTIRAGQNHAYLPMYCLYTVFLAGKLPCIGSYMVRLARNIHLLVYTVHIWYFWQGNHHTYGHVRCVCTVLANSVHNR